MPTTLSDKLPMSYSNTPPGMSLQDNLIWQRFRIQHGHEYDHFYANVRVGDGTAPLQHFDTATAKLLRQLTQHRIDIILVQGQQVTLMEVRNFAGSGALGTIVTNSTLYTKDPTLGTAHRNAILTNNIDADSQAAAQAQGVEVITI